MGTNENRILAKVDKDYINTGDDKIHSRVGSEWSSTVVKSQTWFDFDDIEFEGAAIRFKCLDDDRETYYGGWLFNDDACIMQQLVLSWAMRDAGCTTIEVKDVNNKWCQEIS